MIKNRCKHIVYLYEQLIKRLYPVSWRQEGVLDEMVSVLELRLADAKWETQCAIILLIEFTSAIQNALGAYLDEMLGQYPLLRRKLWRLPMVIMRYGPTSAKMTQNLIRFIDVLEQYNVQASISVTAILLKRYSRRFRQYLHPRLQFLVHGYTHRDYSTALPQAYSLDLEKAQNLYSALGVQARGCRAPYLKPSADSSTVLQTANFTYVSDQPVLFEFIQPEKLPKKQRLRYEDILSFYKPWSASDYPSLPWLVDDRLATITANSLVSIPISLPDDEMLCDRVDGVSTEDLVKHVWLRILAETYLQGELFTIQLHPERIALCRAGLEAVLQRAQDVKPGIWIATLEEIATWWRSRAATQVEVTEFKPGVLSVMVIGPPGVTLLARRLLIFEPTHSWSDGYELVSGLACRVKTDRRPFIGVSPQCPAALASFLKQQGYIVEISPEREAYTFYIDQPEFRRAEARPLLASIEDDSHALMRLGRWPRGARSCLSITGDIDALTLWDYGLRFFE